MKDIEKNTPTKTESAILYQVGSQNLAFLKNLRWNIIYFCFLIYGALVGLNQFFNNDFMKKILLICGLVSFGFCLFMIIEIQCKLQKERKSILSCGNYFLKSLVWVPAKDKAKYIEKYKKFSYGFSFFIFQIIINLVGFAFLLIVLYF